MQVLSLVNRSSITLFLMALSLNLVFFYFNKNNTFYSPEPMHTEVGYNFYKFNSIKRNKKITQLLLHDFKEKFPANERANDRIDPKYIETLDVGTPEGYNAIWDTIGYGLLMGSIWKITRSLSFTDIQLLQIILFSLITLLLYQCAYYFFEDERLAFIMSFCQLMFFPIIFLNVQLMRDIWAYYGIVLLLFVVLKYKAGQASTVFLAIMGTLIGLCQFIRPTIFPVLIAMVVGLILINWIEKRSFESLKKLLITLAITNLIFFWVPFTAYNKVAHGRFLTGPMGQNLFEGLAEFTPELGCQVSDAFFFDYISKNYGISKDLKGTPEFDDKGKEEFLRRFKKDPIFYLKTLLWRFPQIVAPPLTWLFLKKSPYEDCANFKQKLKKSLTSLANLIDLLLRQFYIRIFILIGWIGIALALLRRQYAFVILLLAIISGGWQTYPSHIEYRYLIPFYWAFSFFVGFALNEALCYLRSKKKMLFAI